MKNVRLFDFTAHFNYAIDLWESRYPTLLDSLVAKGYRDTTGMIQATSDRLFHENGYAVQTFVDCRRSLLWKTRFFRKTKAVLFLLDGFVPAEVKSVAPSMLGAGIDIYLVHAPTKMSEVVRYVQVENHEENELPPERDMRPMLIRFNEITDFVARCNLDKSNRELLTEEAIRFRETAEAIGLTAKSNGPLTATSQLKAQIGEYQFVRRMVEELAPLYDIDVPPETVQLSEYEPRNAFRGRRAKEANPDLGLGLTWLEDGNRPATEDIRVPDTTQTYLTWVHIRFLLQHRIKPCYLWADAFEPARFYDDSSRDPGDDDIVFRSRKSTALAEPKPILLTVTECRSRGVKGRMHR